MISDLFSITPIGRKHKVGWPGRNSVVGPKTLYKMFNLAFETGAYEVTFINNQFKWTCSSHIYFQNAINESILKRQLGCLDWIVFDEERHALDFIDRAEKAIVWNLLQKSYPTTLGDLII